MDFMNPIGRTAAQARSGNGCVCHNCSTFLTARNQPGCGFVCMPCNTVNGQANANLARSTATRPSVTANGQCP